MRFSIPAHRLLPRLLLIVALPLAAQFPSPPLVPTLHMQAPGAQPPRPPNVAMLEARIAANPADLDAHVQLARFYLDSGEPSKALPHLKAATELQPNAGPLVFQYGITQLDTGDTDGGYRTLSALARREPNEAATRAFLVRATSRLNKPAETREHLAALRLLVPRDALFHAQLVEWTATEGDAAVALEQIAFALRFPLDNQRKARIRYLEAFVRNRMGQRREATQILKEAIASDPADPRMVAMLLTLQSAGGMHEMDAGLLKETLRRFPTSVDLLLLTGLLNVENQDYRAVNEIATRLDVVAPGNAEGLLLRGHVFLGRNEFDKAAILFREASARGGATPHLLHHLGLAEQKAGRDADALEAFAKAVELGGSDTGLLFAYARLLLNTGEPGKAKPLAEQIAAAEPENPRTFKLLADVERKMGNKEAAKEHLETFKRLSIAAQATRRDQANEAHQPDSATDPAPRL